MEVVNRNSTGQGLWVPVDSTSSPTLYVGSLVKSAGDGVGLVAIASGARDTSQKQVLCGVVTATNDNAYTKTTDETTLQDKITGMTSQAAQTARNFWGANQGPIPANDPQPFVYIEQIDAATILRAPLYNATWGVAPTLLTVTTGSSTGLGFTSNACDFTPVADLCTSFGRSGANVSIARISDDTSTTVETNDVSFPQDIAVGDKFVRVPLRPCFESFVQIDAKSMFFDISQTPATNYFSIIVLRLDLSVAGKEYVEFKFSPEHFMARA